MGKIKDLTGQRFGMLTVIEQQGKTERNYAKWLCKCDCGNYVIRSTDVLRRSGNHSCGCINEKTLKKMAEVNKKHGMTNTRLYGCYKNMKSRCYRKKDIHYNAYGGRGITVCDEWKNNSESFFKWALENGYSDELTLERIDVNKGYCPENCTWIPMSEQYKNKQSNCHKQPLPEPYKGELK